jgi:hypothetical protein
VSSVRFSRNLAFSHIAPCTKTQVFTYSKSFTALPFGAKTLGFPGFSTPSLGTAKPNPQTLDA